MKMKLLASMLGLGMIAVAPSANALVLSTNGALSSKGVASSIISAPSDATDDAAWNDGIQAFNEVIGYTLLADINVDGGTIAKGTRVDSHMIFLNSGPGNSSELIEHGAGGNGNTVTYTFDGSILGVMSKSNGVDEVASSPVLGAAGTTYPASTFAARGMEGNPLDGLFNDDWYSVVGNTISLGMRVTEPGDWIRVVTVSQVPIPPAILMLLTGLLGLGFWSRRRTEA